MIAQSRANVRIPLFVVAHRFDMMPLMARAIQKSTLVFCGLLLCGCDRLDPLAVIDSPDGMAVIIDTIAVRSGDRVICIRTRATQACSRRAAEVVVSGGGRDAEVDPGWASHSRVVVAVTSGKIEQFTPTALSGRVSIEYR